MRVSARLAVFITLVSVGITGCTTVAQPTLPEYRSSSLRSKSVVRASVPDGDSFRVRLSVENRSDSVLSFEPADAAFIQMRTWYAANTLRGTQIHVFAPVEVPSPAPVADRAINVPSQSAITHELSFAYLTGGAYITNLESGRTTVTGGGLSLSALRRLELEPSYSLIVVSPEEDPAERGPPQEVAPAGRRRSGSLILRVGSDTHIIPVDVP